MIREIALPKLGQTMEEATIEKWHFKEGDAVKKGDILLEINTDKAALEVESYYTGTVKRLLYPEGTTLPVNAIIAFIGDAEDQVSEEMVRGALATASKPAAAQPVAAAVVPRSARPTVHGWASQPWHSVAEQALPLPTLLPVEPEAAPAGRVFSSPRARRAAREGKVPLQILRGTGPDGRVIERDVLAYADRLSRLRITPTALEIAYRRGVDLTKVKSSGMDGRIMRADVEGAPVAAGVVPRSARPTVHGWASQPWHSVALTPMRRVVAQRMTLSKTTTPHFYLTMDVDMTDAIALRAELIASWGRKLSFNDLILRACTLAFAKVPEMNCAWADGALLYRGEVNIGLAVGLEGGLIVPVVRNCESKPLREIAETSEGLIEKARNKRLTPDDYEGGCFTISNLGMFGVDTVVPIINPGEVAILGVGRIAPRPVLVGEGIAIRQMTTLVLACDHRLVDGLIAARFFKHVKDALEAPRTLL
jgi:pyruvate dehydrogenase E2 component (dihydrolipoamide acetyltransferase)